MHNKNLSTHSPKNTVLSTTHSTAFHIKDNSYLPHSAAIKFHNIKLTTSPTDPALLTVSAYKTNYTCTPCSVATTSHPLTT